jgi:hypothetical protein
MYWRPSLASQGKPLQRSVGAARAIGGQVRKVYVGALAEDVGVIAEADCRRVGCDGLEIAEQYGNAPVERVRGFSVGKVGVIGDDHDIAPDIGVVNVDVSRVCGLWAEIRRGTAEAGLQVPRSVIKFFKGDGVRP